MDPTGDKQRVLEATDIVRLIGEHTSLKKKGREFVCLCPFHDDHNPSMYVVPAKQIYHCFVCGAGGDAIRFVMDYHKMGFREALEHLAERTGITLTPWRPERSTDATPGTEVPRESMLAANRAAMEFFRIILQHPEHGSAARRFIERRGLSAQMVEQFQLGASPDRWDGLVQTAGHRRMDLRPFLAAGLVKARERSDGHYDALRNRFIFPITDSLGRVIAFGGRALNDDDEPKYLNSPETPLFNKSATLYALPQASATIRSSGVAIVTEGYMDAIACHQAGITNAVATLGTALTSQSARVLSRLCQKVVLLFDGDEAGQRAADRAVEVFFAASLEVRIATLKGAGITDAKDPDELLKQPEGRARLERVLGASVEALAYRFDRLNARTKALPLAARAASIEEEINRLNELGLSGLAPVRQEMIVRRIAGLAGVDTQTVRQAISRAGGKRRNRPESPTGFPQSSETAPYSKPRTNAEAALACLVAEPSLLRELPNDLAHLLAPDAFALEVQKKVAQAVDTVRIMGQTLSTQSVLAGIDDPEAQRIATSMAYQVSRMTGRDSTSLRAFFLQCLDDARRERSLEQALSAATGNDATSAVTRINALQSTVGGQGTEPRRVPRPRLGPLGGQGLGR